MTRDEILAEMVRVAEALERPGLKPEQIERGLAKYNELEAQFFALKEQEEIRVEEVREDVSLHINKIREILGENSKRRRLNG